MKNLLAIIKKSNEGGEHNGSAEENLAPLLL